MAQSEPYLVDCSHFVAGINKLGDIKRATKQT